MNTHAPVHAPSWSESSSVDSRQDAVPAPSRPVVVTLGVAALWIAVVMALAFAARLAFHMSEREAWAYSIGVVSYLYLFIGFVVGLVYLIKSADA